VTIGAVTVVWSPPDDSEPGPALADGPLLSSATSRPGPRPEELPSSAAPATAAVAAGDGGTTTGIVVDVVEVVDVVVEVVDVVDGDVVVVARAAGGRPSHTSPSTRSPYSRCHTP